MVLQPTRCTVRSVSLPSRWALTPPFHPYPTSGRSFSVTLLCPRGHQAVNLDGALRCPDFPPPDWPAAMERACGSKVAQIIGKPTRPRLQNRKNGAGSLLRTASHDGSTCPVRRGRCRKPLPLPPKGDGKLGRASGKTDQRKILKRASSGLRRSSTKNSRKSSSRANPRKY